jgi:hypothetical protein
MTTKIGTRKTSRSRRAGTKAAAAPSRWQVMERGRCAHRVDAPCTVCQALQEMVERSEVLLDVLDSLNSLDPAVTQFTANFGAVRISLRGQISEAKRQLGRG